MLRKEGFIQSLLSKGFIGERMGGILLNKEEDRIETEAVLDAAFTSTLKASEEARHTDAIYYVEEDCALFQIGNGGRKTFVTDIQKPRVKLPLVFRLK
jgi:hypothetical protein